MERDRPELLTWQCPCGVSFWGLLRAHCCGGRYEGCGRVFDTAELFDLHRPDGRCLNPVKLGMIKNAGGVWLPALELTG